jgi:hypothetical protein
LKLCKVAGSGVKVGTVFTFTVDGQTYHVPAGYCVLAGQFALNTKVTVVETIPTGYFLARIVAKPESRLVSKDISTGQAVVKIGSGVTEIIFTNKVDRPTPTPTNTPNGTPTPTKTPNTTPTPTQAPKGKLQICKEAGGDGVSGDFKFRFDTRSRIVPVGTCSLIISVNAGTLTVSEDARAGYHLVDIYTIPANRLISKDLNNRTATVTIVQGNASTQTIVVFVNISLRDTESPNGTSLVPAPDTVSEKLELSWSSVWEMILSSDRRNRLFAGASTN